MEEAKITLEYRKRKVVIRVLEPNEKLMERAGLLLGRHCQDIDKAIARRKR